MTTSATHSDGARTMRLLGTMHIVFGVLWIAACIAGIVSVHAGRSTGPQLPPTFPPDFVFALIGAVAALLIVAGVRLRDFDEWGRRLSYVWAALVIAPTLLLSVSVFAFIVSARSESFHAHAFTSGVADLLLLPAFVVGVPTVLLLAYPIVTLIVLARSKALVAPKA